jgi:hypothetical protein
MREETLALVLRKIGPFQFSAIERFEAGAATPNDDGYMCDGMICRDLRYPQIDSPVAPGAERWNADMAAWAEETYRARTAAPPAGMTDLSVEALVMFADVDFISVERGAVWFTEGSARSGSALERDNRWLSSGRKLEPGDLFDPATDWAGALKQAAAAELAKQHPNVKMTEAIERARPPIPPTGRSRNRRSSSISIRARANSAPRRASRGARSPTIWSRRFPWHSTWIDAHMARPHGIHSNMPFQ